MKTSVKPVYRVIFFKCGKVLRHQISISKFQDKPKLVCGCKLLDIYFSGKKRYFWKILIVSLSKPKFHKNQGFYTFPHVIEAEIRNPSEKLFLNENKN